MPRWIVPTKRAESIERRRHRRLQVQNGAFATLSDRVTTLGQIVDISKGGLSFRYVARQDQSNGSSELKILLTDGTFRFDKVPFKRVWDLAMPREFSLGSITMRQCGVQFQKLEDHQRFDLEHFIQNCTVPGTSTSY